MPKINNDPEDYEMNMPENEGILFDEYFPVSRYDILELKLILGICNNVKFDVELISF